MNCICERISNTNEHDLCSMKRTGVPRVAEEMTILDVADTEVDSHSQITAFTCNVSFREDH